MAAKKSHGARLDRVEEAFLRLEDTTRRLEVVQRDASERLGRIEETLHTSSKLFERMHERLESLEDGQKVVVERLEGMEEGQKLIVDRLDRLVEIATRERTQQIERITRLETRMDALERRIP